MALSNSLPHAAAVPRASSSVTAEAIPVQQVAGRRLRWSCALATAILWWLAGQQSGLFALGWIALVPLLWALHGLDGCTRFRFGWTAGWLCFALINWWIVPTVARGGAVIGASLLIGTLLGVIAVALIATIHGSMVALAALAWSTRGGWVERAPWILPLAFALLWASLDALRSQTPLAHSWGALAYTQWRDLPLWQIASVIGQHGLTFLCAWFGASLALWARRGDRALWCAPLVVFAVVHGWGAWRLQASPVDEQRAARKLRVLLVQTNVPSLRKNEAGGENEPFREAYLLTREATAPQRLDRQPYDIIVWPETTVDLAGPSTTQLRAVLDLSRDLQSSLLIGARTFDPRREAYFNDALLARPDGMLANSAKARLVPFGERAPFGEYLPFLRRFAPRPEVAPGLTLKPLELNASTRIGSIICFESCFSTPARRLRGQGAQAIFVLTNDEWFRGTNAPWEHAVMAALRAVENNVPVAQAANGGYSFAVDRHGRFMVKSSINTAQTVSVDLPLP
jgi:apolipoprotein N-acyltransferase